MSVLYLDVDGTLIDASDQPNVPLVCAALAWVTRLTQQKIVAPQRIIVWSGGGIDYAQLWTDRLFGWANLWANIEVIGGAKRFSRARTGDIVVDDAFESNPPPTSLTLQGVRTYTPTAFVRAYLLPTFRDQRADHGNA